MKQNTWNCRKDCQYLTLDGCYIDDKMPNPKGDLSFELEDLRHPTCWMYMKPLMPNEPTQEQIKIACKLCAGNNGAGCTQMYSPDLEHWICKAWLVKAKSGQFGR